MTPTIFQNLEFFLLLPFALLIPILARRLGSVAYRLSIIAVSVFFIAALPGISGLYLIFLLAVILISYAIGKLLIWLGARTDGKKIKGSGFALLFAIALFVLVKYSVVTSFVSDLLSLKEPYTSRILPLLGFAFFGVKLYSFFVDVSAKKIKSLSFIDFICYFAYFPSFLAGPITRYPSFSKQLALGAKQRLSAETLRVQLPRFVFGIFKVFVVAAILHRFALPFLDNGKLIKTDWVYFGAIAYYWYEYMNFSGYSDLAVSTSKILGVDIPENFNLPFMAKSLTELWRRWHISLAEWLRDYIYYPFLFTMMSAFKPKKKIVNALLSAFAIFVTFVLCGFWHGETWGMILFGVLSGLCLGAEAILTQTIGPKVKAWLKGRPGQTLIYDNIARLVTFHVAMATFAPVLLSNEQLKLVTQTLIGFASRII